MCEVIPITIMNSTTSSEESVKFYVHKTVLISSSEYFRNLFTSKTQLVEEDFIILRGCDPQVFNAILMYMYFKVWPSNNVDLKNMYSFSLNLRIYNVSVLEDMIVAAIDDASIVPTIHWAHERRYDALIERLIVVFLNNFNMYMQCIPMDRCIGLPPDVMARILTEYRSTHI